MSSLFEEFTNSLGIQTPATESFADESVEKTEEQTEQPTDTPEEEKEIDINDIPDDELLTAGTESLVFLDALRATSSREEFNKFLHENGTDLELYGIVDVNAIARESLCDGDSDDVDEENIATEAKNIVRLNKEANLSRETARISIGLAKRANDNLYKQYHKHSVLKREFRDKIYTKYGAKATTLARKSLMNSRNRASIMNSQTGTTIINKIDSRIRELDQHGRNNNTIKDSNGKTSKPRMVR